MEWYAAATLGDTIAMGGGRFIDSMRDLTKSSDNGGGRWSAGVAIRAVVNDR